MGSSSAIRPVYRSTAPGTLSLLREMGRRPATRDRVPDEDQATIVLAWLCDHSHAMARAVVGLFAGGDPDVVAVLEAGVPLSTAFQVRLPSLPGTGLLFADLSLVAPDRMFQLLVEVKLGAAFNMYSIDGQTMLQPDAYLRAWRQCDPEREARVRRLGTLQLLPGPTGNTKDPWRAGDLLWRDLQERLGQMLSAGELDADVGAIAGELNEHLKSRILAPDYDPALLDHGKRLLDAICETLVTRVPGATRRSKARILPGSHHAAAHFQLRAPNGSECDFWLGLTPAASNYNVPGWPTVVQIEAYAYDGDDVELALLEAGFESVADRAGYESLRARLLDDPQPNGDSAAQCDEAVGAMVELFTAAGWL